MIGRSPRRTPSIAVTIIRYHRNLQPTLMNLSDNRPLSCCGSLFAPSPANANHCIGMAGFPVQDERLSYCEGWWSRLDEPTALSTLTLCLGAPKNPLRILGPSLAHASPRRPVLPSPGADARLPLNLRYPVCQLPL